jgi:hypothetical protein
MKLGSKYRGNKKDVGGMTPDRVKRPERCMDYD